MSDALDPTRKETLSSHLDNEIETASAEALMQDNFAAQLHYRNLESVSRATQQSGTSVPAMPDFLSRVMGSIEDIEQEDPADDFEVLSAWSDGEWDFTPEEITVQAEVTRHQIQTLGTALRALPVPAASDDFATRVMQAVAQTESPELETLSALYDSETHFAEVRCLLDAELPAASQTQVQNFRTLSSALHRLNTPTASADFAERLLAALPASTPDFENLSAHHDLEANLELTTAEPLLESFTVLSSAMQALPAMTAPADFMARVMQAVDAAEFETVSAHFDAESLSEADEPFTATQTRQLQQVQALSAGLAALPVVTAPVDFAQRVVAAIEADFADVSAHFDNELSLTLTEEQQAQLTSLTTLSQGFAALPAMTAPVGFAEAVMQRIDALPSFEDLSEAFDGESKLNFSDEQLQPLRALSRAMAALPAPQAPADFVAKVMLATEQKPQKARLFALPSLFQTRLGQMAAGFAIFGMLVMANQVINRSEPGSTTASVPVETVVQVENSPEDMLFSNPEVTTVMDNTMDMEISTENDYNSWIGG